jgi:hypothetical protein
MSSTRLKVAAGVAGPIAFLLGSTIIGATRADYDPTRHFVSLLSLTAAGWPMTLTFLVSGVLLLIDADGLAAAMLPGRGRRAVPAGIGLAGLGLVLAGIFATDPIQGYPPGTPLEMPSTASPQAALHLIGALLLFGGMAAAATFGARRSWLDGDRRWAWYSLITAILVLVANAVTSTPPGSISPLAGVAGLLQRISITAGLVWVLLTSLRMLRWAVPGSTRAAPRR